MSIDIEKSQVLDLASSFVNQHWTTLNEDDITVSILSGGNSGRLYIVEDISKTSNVNPHKKFLIRLYGGKLVEKDDIIKAGKCETSEGIIFFANGLQGLGPKLLGVFDGGRVEEFVPSHVVTEADLADETISKELIRKLARFHALQLPVSKKKRDLLYMSAAYQDEYKKENILKLVKRSGANADDYSFLDEDYHTEHAFLRRFEPKVGGRIVFCHGDLNKNNILVRDTPDQFNERVMLIDYELAATDYRGSDLAQLLLARMIERKADGSFQKVCGYPDDEYRRSVVIEYLKETRKLNYFEFDDAGVDSVDHVMMEVDFFALYVLQLVQGFFKKMPNSEYLHQQSDAVVKSWVDVILEMSTMYTTHKNYFVNKYDKVL